jgi:hypothetical protein
MGLFTGLLLLPLAPVRMTVWVAEKIAEQAALEMGEGPIRRELAELDALHAAGELDEEEYSARQETLLQALLAARDDSSGRLADG